MVQGDDILKAISIKISSTETVSSLRKLIWGEKTHAFQNFNADTLVLRKVSIPVAARGRAGRWVARMGLLLMMKRLQRARG